MPVEGVAMCGRGNFQYHAKTVSEIFLNTGEFNSIIHYYTIFNCCVDVFSTISFEYCRKVIENLL